MDAVRDSTSLRSLVPGVYAPWTAVAMGLGVLVVALPLYLLDVGLSFTATSVVLAASGFGSFAGALPSGSAIARYGEWPVICGSLVVVGIAVGLTATSADPNKLHAHQLAVGAAATAMRLASLTTITRSVTTLMRGRANSTMGGIRRLGGFIGPLIGGVLVDLVGFNVTFLLSAAVTGLGLVPLLTAARRSPVSTQGGDGQGVGLLASLRRHRGLLLRSTSGPFLIMTARRGRTVILPLIAAALGVSATAVGAIVAVGTGADLLLFPVAGWLMDRFGRLRAIAPAFLLMAGGLFLLGAVDTTLGVVMAGAIIGVGNGLSSGSLMTMASDLAPRESASQFIAGFAAIQDVGQMLGPLIVGVVADSAGLGTAATMLGALLLVGVVVIVSTVGETAAEALQQR